jgi:N-acetylmuramoyl-L-alanine amidase
MGAKMPAILVELGYITNKKEGKRLQVKSYLTRIAQGIVNGILAYKHQIEHYASL